MEKSDCFTYYSCVSGSCPRIVEREIYGNDSGCAVYCGDDKYCGCDKCYFEGSDICKECIHEEEKE